MYKCVQLGRNEAEVDMLATRQLGQERIRRRFLPVVTPAPLTMEQFHRLLALQTLDVATSTFFSFLFGKF